MTNHFPQRVAIMIQYCIEVVVINDVQDIYYTMQCITATYSKDFHIIHTKAFIIVPIERPTSQIVFAVQKSTWVTF